MPVSRKRWILRLSGLGLGVVVGASSYLYLLRMPGQAEPLRFTGATAAPALERQGGLRTETATLACGCFWGPDARFGVLPGVVRTRSGYSGGQSPHPDYEHIGDHTESVEIDFDPQRLSFRELMQAYAALPNVGRHLAKRQYRNAVFCHSQDQLKIAREVLADKVGRTVDVEAFGSFTRAEDYHQKFHLRGSGLMPEFQSSFTSFSSFVDSTAAARANGYVSGYGEAEQVRQDASRLGLSPSGQQELVRLHQHPGLHCQ